MTLKILLENEIVKADTIIHLQDRYWALASGNREDKEISQYAGDEVLSFAWNRSNQLFVQIME